MPRLHLHLFGSVVLGLVLLVLAELPRPTVARASDDTTVSISTEDQPQTTQARPQTLLERCRELMGLPPYIHPSQRVEVPFVPVRPNCFGWNYLPARPLPW
jgi:hypothetical protein